MQQRRVGDAKTMQEGRPRMSFNNQPPLIRPPSLPIHQLQKCIGNHALTHLLQAKLKINLPGDIYEQEADRVAEQVMRMPGSVPSLSPNGLRPNLKRKCAACESGEGLCSECAEGEKTIQRKPLPLEIMPLIQRQVDEPEEDEEEIVQNKASAGTPVISPSMERHIRSVRRDGQPLPESVRAFFEPRLGYDFSQVRIHTGANAAESARAVNALAYTVGRDVVFGAGQYAPATTEGQRLLAHELTHTIQQETITPEWVQRRAVLFNPDSVAQQLRGAMEGPGTDEESIYAALSGHTQDELTAIKAAYLRLTRRELLDDLRDELSGNELQRALGQMDIPPTVYEQNTEVGGLSVGNFDFHFRNCAVLIWVWVKYQFTDDINSTEKADFKRRFVDAVHRKWAHSGYSLSESGSCPCPSVPIEVHVEENPGSFYHKLVDVEREPRRPMVISDINVSLNTDDDTLAHEFGHVLGLYDEYDGGFFENIMFWHRNRPDDPNALMNIGTQLRPRYFEHYRLRVQATAPLGCKYAISSPVPPVT